MKKILDEEGKPIRSIVNTIGKATRIFADTVVKEVDEIIKEKHICAVKIILDITAGEVIKYDVITTKHLCDDNKPFAFVEDENE